MPALRTLGLVILAVLAVSIGILGYVYMRAVFDESAARDAALKVRDACQTVINNGGGQQVENITLPGNYHMYFIENDNQISVDSYRVPTDGLFRRFAENVELGPGNHKLTIRLDENNRLVVTRIW